MRGFGCRDFHFLPVILVQITVAQSFGNSNQHATTVEQQRICGRETNVKNAGFQTAH